MYENEFRFKVNSWFKDYLKKLHCNAYIHQYGFKLSANALFLACFTKQA